jgi:protein tyrosine/serine phosphatase
MKNAIRTAGLFSLLFGIWISHVPAKQDSSKTEPTRPETWARPVELEGAPNLHRVSDDLYRSAQPTAEGMKALKKMGIRTIVSLRYFRSDRDEIGTTALDYVRIPIQAFRMKDDHIIRFLNVVLDTGKTPVLVHCKHGADRTGTACAAYRMIVQGWTREEAIREMKKGEYGFHKIFGNVIKYLEELDVEKMRKKVGIP